MATHEDPDASAAKALVADVFSASAPTYDQVIEFFGPFGRSLVAAADVRPGHAVLDVASGRGACLWPALEAVGPTGRVLGIDLSEGMVEHLSADLRDHGADNAEVRVADAEHLPLPDASVDRITAGFMIFFCPDGDRVLREFHRVLRPGGVVALSTFDGDVPTKWLQSFAEEVFGPITPRAGDAFDRSAILEPALRHGGFTQVEGIDVHEPLRYANVEEVEQWHRSHFARLMLDALDDDQLARYRHRVAEYLEHARTPRGYELTQRARITVARR